MPASRLWKGEGPGGMFGEWGQVGITDISGNLDWSPRKVLEYVRSFKDNLLNAQPIVLPKELDRMVEQFLSRFIETPRGAMTGAKRKRSIAGTKWHWQIRKHRIPRDISSALVLLVLALGEICHTDKAPRAGVGSILHTESRCQLLSHLLLEDIGHMRNCCSINAYLNMK